MEVAAPSMGWSGMLSRLHGGPKGPKVVSRWMKHMLIVSWRLMCAEDMLKVLLKRSRLKETDIYPLERASYIAVRER